MRQISIQYPDGSFHKVDVTRFYSIMRNKEEVFVIEYDDLTVNKRNYFSVLEKQNDVFVNKDLGSAETYKDFYLRARFCIKRVRDVQELPERVMMRSVVQQNAPVNNGTQPQQQSQQPQRPTQPPTTPQNSNGNKPKLTVYVAQYAPQEPFPYFIKADVAVNLGYTEERRGYFPLVQEELTHILETYDVSYEGFLLSPINYYYHRPRDLGREVAQPTPQQPTSPEKRKLTVLYDVAKTLEHPYYLSISAAESLGLTSGTRVGTFYHLTEEELENLIVTHDVNIVSQHLNVGRRTQESQTPTVPEQLTEYELGLIDRLYDSIVDFEDYYKFFGFQDMRDSSPEDILSSPAMKELERVLNKGKECENSTAIQLLEFLDGFKEELNRKIVLK